MLRMKNLRKLLFVFMNSVFVSSFWLLLCFHCNCFESVLVVVQAKFNFHERWLDMILVLVLVGLIGLMRASNGGYNCE